MTRTSDKTRADAQALRDRLKEEGRHHDAQIIQHLLISSATSSSLNGVLHRDNAALRDQLKERPAVGADLRFGGDANAFVCTGQYSRQGEPGEGCREGLRVVGGDRLFPGPFLGEVRNDGSIFTTLGWATEGTAWVTEGQVELAARYRWLRTGIEREFMGGQLFEVVKS